MNEQAVIEIILSNLIAFLLVIGAVIVIWKGVKIVPQSEIFVLERFGKFTRALKPGLNFIVPFLDAVAHRVSVLERQLEAWDISVITKDNVEVELETTVFYRVLDASRSVYRIRNVDRAIHTAATSIVRSAAGKLELDELQSSRESMNSEIEKNLQNAAEVWGIEITRTEIIDIKVDGQTREAQRHQLSAERERRASIARAEGEKRSVELAAEARLFEAQREAEARITLADADAYTVKVAAEAEANQIRAVAAALQENGMPAANYEILKRQIGALGEVASSDNAKTVIMPTEISGVIGSLTALLESLPRGQTR
ncbi:SPFH domain-containing protein [Nisaea sp.]|uniref:SPFH domain-containing protein n=1 Tax=Nisaea sp. TaxID=2024842 RepID=UPI002B26E914|nr:SPFH domain-containing protein [Nisaea sp.]